ncbi:hypothetical protein BSKO_13320 [Bryopsis sp. KO-2023]|nr:hypothetical protein BSKO_13320 [Bryopsis sp. KO-2023]
MPSASARCVVQDSVFVRKCRCRGQLFHNPPPNRYHRPGFHPFQGGRIGANMQGRSRNSPTNRAKKSSTAAPKTFPLPSGATQRRVQFKNKFNETLVGVFVDAGSDNVVILCHGYSSSKDSFHFPAIANELAKKSISSLRFDFSGNGDSAGVFDFGNYAKEVGEIRGAVMLVRDQLRKTVHGLVGHSKGGNDVLLYSSAFDDVPYVVNIAGRFDMKQGLTERFGQDIFAKLEKHNQVEMPGVNSAGASFKWLLTKRSMEERVNTDMKLAAERIKVSEVLTIHGTEDRVIPFEDAKRFAEFIRPHMLAPIEKADHNFTNTAASQAMIQKLTAFFTSGL